MDALHIVFLLEEESARALIETLAPRLLRDIDTHECIVFRGKRDLLKKLPQRLRAYASWLPDSYRLVVLLDRDRQDCKKLKQELDAMARQAGLRRFSLAHPLSRQRPGKAPQIVNRIAVEPGRNRSPSFQCFRRALIGLVEHRFR